MRCFHFALVALQPFFEPVELRPVRRQANPEYSHLGFLRLFHFDLRRVMSPSSAVVENPM